MTHTPQTKPQRVFDKIVREWGTRNEIEIHAYYHDTETVSIDGYLHQIMNLMTEYGFGDDLLETIDDALDKIGYFIENKNGCDFGFYRS